MNSKISRNCRKFPGKLGNLNRFQGFFQVKKKSRTFPGSPGIPGHVATPLFYRRIKTGRVLIHWWIRTRGVLIHRYTGTEVCCEFCGISHNIFFKEPFGRLLLHRHSFCLLSHQDLSSFQKRCHTYFLVECYFGLICRLGTRMSSIFHGPGQKPIFNPVEHLRWNFLAKIVNSLKLLSIFA